MKKIEANGYIKDGKLHIRNRAQFDREISQFTNCELDITVEKKRSKRSIEQNKYWWVCVTELAKEFGYSATEMHDIMKFKFLRAEKVNEKTGECFEYLRSTTELNKSEFSELVERMISFAGEHGVMIKQPNTQLEII